MKWRELYFILFSLHIRIYNLSAVDKKDPAQNAGQVEKWASTLDFLAAARLFNVNIIVSGRHPKTGEYYWQRYTPRMRRSLLLAQERERTSIFINYLEDMGHYQVILDV